MVVSFTGHRQLYNESREAVEGRLADTVERLYKSGAREFCSGGALGFDTLAAIAVLRLKRRYPDVRLTMLLPCRDQDARWYPEQKRLYRQILAHADECVYVSDYYTPSCMRDRNRELVRRASLLVAYYTGREPSGTGATVRMAYAKGIEVINLCPSR